MPLIRVHSSYLQYLKRAAIECTRSDQFGHAFGFLDTRTPAKALLAQPDDSCVWRVQPPPQASPGFLRMLEEALHAEEQGKPFGGTHGLLHCWVALLPM